MREVLRLDRLPPLELPQVLLVDRLVVEGQLPQQVLLLGLGVGQEGQVVLGLLLQDSVGAEVGAEGIGFGCAHEFEKYVYIIYIYAIRIRRPAPPGTS